MAATDLNVSLTAELKSTNASEGGITLGAKNLHELIANALDRAARAMTGQLAR